MRCSYERATSHVKAAHAARLTLSVTGGVPDQDALI
jgi:hypothetical protein